MGDVELVLLPGLDGSGVLFRPLLDRLPEHIPTRVISYPVDQMLGYDELLPRVLNSLPKEKPFVLLGESFSGPISLMAAAKGIPNLIGVILCATFVRNPLWLRPGWLHYFSRPVVYWPYPLFARIKAWLYECGATDLVALKSEALRDVRPEVIAHRVRALLKVDVRRELMLCAVPMLYLRGDRDLVVPGQNMREIVRLRPDVKVAHLTSPHMVVQTQPGAAAEAITSFIESVRASGSSVGSTGRQATPASG
jgi:pimeloyl-ACP methyl ester carboxylesterase